MFLIINGSDHKNKIYFFVYDIDRLFQDQKGKADRRTPFSGWA